MKKTAVFTILFLSVIINAQVQPEVEMYPKQGHIGDVFNYSLRLPVGSGTTVVLRQPSAADLGAWTLLDVRKGTVRKGKDREFQLDMKVTCFDTAFQAFPSLELTLNDSVAGETVNLITDSVYVYIASLLDSLRDELPDQYGPQKISVFSMHRLIILALLLAAAVAALIYGLSRKKQTKIIRPDEKVLSPGEKFRADLDALERSELPLKGRFKDFFEEFNYIIKSYLEGMYFIHLKELSSIESLDAMSGILAVQDLAVLRELFETGDAVKYAAEKSGLEMCREVLARARNFADTLENPGNG